MAGSTRWTLARWPWGGGTADGGDANTAWKPTLWPGRRPARYPTVPATCLGYLGYYGKGICVFAGVEVGNSS